VFWQLDDKKEIFTFC